MPSLTIEVDAIRALGTDLNGVADEFENANARSDAIAEALGHPGLADTVRDFAHKWDDTREKMTKAMRALASAAHSVADTWVDFDQQGADVLTGAGAGGGGRPVPAP